MPLDRQARCPSPQILMHYAWIFHISNRNHFIEVMTYNILLILIVSIVHIIREEACTVVSLFANTTMIIMVRYMSLDKGRYSWILFFIFLSIEMFIWGYRGPPFFDFFNIWSACLNCCYCFVIFHCIFTAVIKIVQPRFRSLLGKLEPWYCFLCWVISTMFTIIIEPVFYIERLIKII